MTIDLCACLERGHGGDGNGGDGWESNPPGAVQHRPSDSFEDCGEHQPPYIPEVGRSLHHRACHGLGVSPDWADGTNDSIRIVQRFTPS